MKKHALTCLPVGYSNIIDAGSTVLPVIDVYPNLKKVQAVPERHKKIPSSAGAGEAHEKA